MYRVVVLVLQVGMLLCLPAAWAQDAPSATHFLDIPSPGQNYSGVGAIHGWICQPAGELTIRFDDGESLPLLYGAQREDVLAAGNCDHAGVGFVTIWNWGELGEGEHTAIAYDDGVPFAEHTFTVATFGVSFLEDAEGGCMIDDFPAPGETAHFTWTQGTQHLELEMREMQEEEAESEDESGMP